MSTSPAPSTPSTTATAFAVTLFPVLALTFIAFMVTGLAMPVLPLHVHDNLGMGTVVVGLVTGAQFATALVSLAGPRNTGKAIAWIGMAMYVAFAVGAPIGTLNLSSTLHLIR